MSEQGMVIELSRPATGLAGVCEPILRSLPRWFGRDEVTARYLDGIPTLTARRGAEVVGFLTLQLHTPLAAEVHLMTVRESWHRRGVGTRLLARVEAYLVERGTEHLQVKTLGPSHLDCFYAAPRAFYEAVGFRPLEELADFWGEGTPCLLMVKRLER